MTATTMKSAVKQRRCAADPVNGKLWHASKQAALNAAIRHEAKWKVTYRAYQCTAPKCKGWHLTTRTGATLMNELHNLMRDMLEREILAGFSFRGDPGSFHPVVESIATTVVAVVRAYDVEHGPSEAEIEAGWFEATGISGPFPFEGTVFPQAIVAALEAAAKVRAEQEQR